MKVRIDRLKRVVNMLVGRAEARGDLGHFTKKNESLTNELRLAGKRLQDAKKEIQCSEKRAGELHEEIRLLRESNVGSMDTIGRSSISRSIQTSPGERFSSGIRMSRGGCGPWFCGLNPRQFTWRVMLRQSGRSMTGYDV